MARAVHITAGVGAAGTTGLGFAAIQLYSMYLDSQEKLASWSSVALDKAEQCGGLKIALVAADHHIETLKEIILTCGQ